MLVIHKDDSGLLSINVDAHFFAHVILCKQNEIEIRKLNTNMMNVIIPTLR